MTRKTRELAISRKLTRELLAKVYSIETRTKFCGRTVKCTVQEQVLSAQKVQFWEISYQ